MAQTRQFHVLDRVYSITPKVPFIWDAGGNLLELAFLQILSKYLLHEQPPQTDTTQLLHDEFQKIFPASTYSPVYLRKKAVQQLKTKKRSFTFTMLESDRAAIAAAVAAKEAEAQVLERVGQLLKKTSSEAALVFACRESQSAIEKHNQHARNVAKTFDLSPADRRIINDVYPTNLNKYPDIHEKAVETGA